MTSFEIRVSDHTTQGHSDSVCNVVFMGMGLLANVFAQRGVSAMILSSFAGLEPIGSNWSYMFEGHNESPPTVCRSFDGQVKQLGPSHSQEMVQKNPINPQGSMRGCASFST